MRLRLLCAIFCLNAGLGVALAQTEELSTVAPVMPLVQPATMVGSMPELGDRFQAYLRRTYSWQRMSMLALDTGIDSVLGDTAWGRGFDGFGCRYAHRFGRRVVGNSIEFAAGALLREDLRYRSSLDTAKRARVQHAVKSAFLAYRDDGSRGITYARFAGYSGRALISATWCPQPLSAARIGRDAGFGVFDQVSNNLLHEFSPDLKRFGYRTWNSLRHR